MKKIYYALFLFGGLMQAQYSENFDAGVPGSMTQTQHSGTINWTDSCNSVGDAPCPLTGAKSASFSQEVGSPGSSTSLMTPNINLASGNFKLSFNHVQRTDFGATNVLYVEISTNGGSTWTTMKTYNATVQNKTEQIIDMSSYSTTAQTRIRFRAVSNLGPGILIDDINVTQVGQNDVKLSSVELNRYNLINTNNTIKFNVLNSGNNTVNNVELKWNDGVNNHVITQNVTLAPGASTTISHTTPVNYSTAVEKTITATVTKVNGVVDNTDTTKTAKFNSVSQAVDNKILFEKGTGTWCGACVHGIVSMKYMDDTYGNQKFIGIAVHNNDVMTVAEHNNGLNIPAFPSAVVNRKLRNVDAMTNAGMEAGYNKFKDDVVPAAIDLTISGSGANVGIAVKSTFYTPFASANYRLGVIIMEDGIKGNNASYNQANYASGSSTPVGGFESQPNPAPYTFMVYDHVSMALLGGFNGQAGSVPTAISNGTVANYSFNYTVPSTSNRTKMYAIAVLIDQTTGEIVNSAKKSIDETLSIANEQTINLKTYPVPANDVLNVECKLEEKNCQVALFDMQGREVLKKDYKNVSGNAKFNLAVGHLAPGTYLLSIITENASFSRRVLIK